MKRLFDAIAALAGLILLAPLFAVVAILIKIDSPGRVLFRHQRVGRNFAPFFVYKFRTMREAPLQDASEITVKGDARVTRVGRILRKAKIDELPQLLNVLKGEMSLVGPRPEVGRYVELYRKEYEEILSVRPGITDISSIAFRDEELILKGVEDPEEYYRRIVLPEKIRLAREYIKRGSFLYDLRLIAKTLYRVLLPPPGEPRETPRGNRR